MTITALVENKSDCELKAKHGLSLYIETQKHKILFDIGPDSTLFENAAARGINLSDIDTVVISHGHVDHAGALKQFLQINSTAKIYVQRCAFERHYSKFLFFKINVGIDPKFQKHPQIILVDGDFLIDEELQLFTVESSNRFYSPANNSLYDQNGRDSFSHEHNLIIKEKKTVLIMGCGHTGVINILEKAKKYQPKACVGGYHLFNPMTGQTVPAALLDAIKNELKKYSDIELYTCHCTGMKAFLYLSEGLFNLHYLSCGQTIEIK